MPPGHGGDHAANQPPGSDSGLPASTVQAHSAIEVSRGIEVALVEPQQQAPQVGLACVAAGPGEHFHDDRLRDSDRSVGRDEFREAQAQLQAIVDDLGRQRPRPPRVRAGEHQGPRDGGVTAVELEGEATTERQSDHMRSLQPEGVDEGGEAVGEVRQRE